MSSNWKSSRIRCALGLAALVTAGLPAAALRSSVGFTCEQGPRIVTEASCKVREANSVSVRKCCKPVTANNRVLQQKEF